VNKRENAVKGLPAGGLKKSKRERDMTCCCPNSNRGFSGAFYCSVDEVLHFHACLIPTLAGGEWSAARAGRITPDTESNMLDRPPEPIWMLWKGEWSLALLGIVK
jgi:hypothetical protein